MFSASLCMAFFKLPLNKCEVGKARTGMAVDAGNFRESPCVAKDKMLKMCIFCIGQRHRLHKSCSQNK